MSAEHSLHIELFGHFRLRYKGELITAIDSVRLQSFLVYLLLHHGIPQNRQYVSFILWPDSSERQARTNLRKLIHQLNTTFPEIHNYLDDDGKTLLWKDEQSYFLDVKEFERAIERAENAMANKDHHSAIDAFKYTVSLYGNDLFPPCYDEWIEAPRERFRNRFIQSLETLTGLLTEHRDYHTAISYANQLLGYDPVHEGAARQLMTLYSLVGERARALRVYHTLTKTLSRELGVKPEGPSEELYKRLLSMDSGEEQLPAQTTHRASSIHTPFVGRHEEWKLLLQSWTTASTLTPLFTLVSGEAGIGKTRLLEELMYWSTRQGIVTAKTRSYAVEGKIAFGPLTEWLRSKPVYDALHSVEPESLREVSRLLPEINQEYPDLPPSDPLTESWQRRKFLEALSDALTAPSRPLLLIIDDLQWCDRETLEFLNFLYRTKPDARFLIAGSVRPEEIGNGHPLTDLLTDIRKSDQLTEIHLSPLNKEDTRILAGHLLEAEIDNENAQQLFHNTEGNPLFIVETIRMETGSLSGNITVPATGSQSVTHTTGLPPKVKTTIQRRLLQLSETSRELVYLAAIIGREFTFDVLYHISELDEHAFVNALNELWQKGIIREQGTDTYDFSHDKIREVAYHGISNTRRRYSHKRIAETYETLYSEIPDNIASRIAFHYEQAHHFEKAINYYHISANAVLKVYAYDDAIKNFQKALSLLEHVTDETERNKIGIELEIALGNPLVATLGYGATEVKRVYSRIITRYRKLNIPSQPPVIRALALNSLARGEIDQAYDFGRQLMNRAKQENSSLALVEAHYVLGVVLFWMGNYEQSKKHLELALEYYSPDEADKHITLFSQDAGVICLVRLALTNWYYGYPDLAVQQGNEAVERADYLGHPLTRAYALNYASWVHIEYGNIEQVGRYTSRLIEHCEQWDLQFWPHSAAAMDAWLRNENNTTREWIQKIRESLNTFPTVGHVLHRPYVLLLAIKCFVNAKKVDEGLKVVHEALHLSKRTGERYLDAEYYRLKGILLAHRKNHSDIEIESCFLKSLQIARSQRSKSLELRTLLSLAEFYQSCNSTKKYKDTLTSLTALREEFTEGFQSADLLKAKHLETGNIGQ